MRFQNLKKTILILALLSIISVFPVFSAGNKEVPEIPPITSGPQYLSPNDDGVQDDATIDFSVKIYVKSDNGYVPEYGLKIKNPSGDTVAESSCKEKSDVFWLFQLFMGYSEFNLEKTISWDGTNKEGEILPDGEYKVTLWVMDAQKHIKEIELEDFIIDTKKPEVKLRTPEKLLFSPNGDGKEDVFNVIQADGTIEKQWNGVFKDETGNTVKTFTWDDASPGNLSWDGTDNDGLLVKNGIYRYEIQTTDLAGNKSDIKEISNIELDASAPAFSLEMDSSAFSPNGDNVKDTLLITPVYENSEAITSWSWSIANSKGVILSKEGKAETVLPETIEIDGLDNSGFPIFPGQYVFSMSLNYTNEWTPVVKKDISIDITPPGIEITTDRPIFSPNDDGMGDTVSIKFKSNEVVTWEGSIVNMEGDTVLKTDYTQTTSFVSWDGSDEKGEKLPDGDYLMLGIFTDLAGNVTDAEPFLISIDTLSVNTKISVPKGFSPNGDGIEDNLTITVDSNLYEDIDIWKLDIIDDSGKAVKTITGNEVLSKEINWDGTVLSNENPQPALDGVYQAILYVNYIKGDSIKVQSDLFYLDIKPPKISLVVKSDSIAKTEEGLKGDVLFSVDVEEERDVRSWMLDVYDRKGNNIRSFAGEGNPSGNITWNTSEDKDKIAGDEKYTINLKVTDEAGNVSEMNEKISLDVMLVKRNGKYYLTIPNIIFGAYKYTLDSAGPAREKANYESLKKLIDITERFPNYNIVLEAHALNIYLKTERQAKEETILQPLTEKRANEVRKALLDMGMDPGRISTEAYGGLQPMVSVADRSIRWKNRRVEFCVTGIKQ